jgi:hypothetical protein
MYMVYALSLALLFTVIYTFQNVAWASGEKTNNTCDSEVAVKQDVDDTHHCYADITDIPSELPIAMECNDVKHDPSTRVECSSFVSIDTEIGTHSSLPLLPVNIKEEIDHVESESITHKHCHTDRMAVHGGIKPHTCVTCYKAFIRKDHLNAHMATVHSGGRRYSCDTCMKSFAHRQTLTNHILVHSGIK